MKNCPHCNRMNNDDARFCDSCGAQLAVTDTPSVGQDAETSGGNDGKTVLIENRTALSKQIISNFYRPNLYFGFAFISVGVIGIVLSVFLPQLSKIWWYVIMGFVAVIGALFLTIYFQNKKNELFDENKSQTYSFDEDALTARYYDGDREVSSGTIPYSFISKVIFGKDMIAIYYQKNGLVYIVDRHGFTKGSDEELRRLLKERCLPAATKKL